MDKESAVGESSPLFLLMDAGATIQRDMSSRLRKLKLSVEQQRILCLAYFAERHLSAALLAAILLVEPYSVRNALKGLSSRGLVTSRHEGSDKKTCWIVLTPRGRKAAEAATELILQTAKELNAVTIDQQSDDLLEMAGYIRDKGAVMADVPADVRHEALERVWGTDRRYWTSDARD